MPNSIIMRRQEHTNLRELFYYMSPSIWRAMHRAGIVMVFAPYLPHHDARVYLWSTKKPAANSHTPCFH